MNNAGLVTPSPAAPELGYWTKIAIGMGFTVVLVVAQILFDRTFLGHQVEQLTYNLVQRRLSLPPETPLDIVIVDISEIEKEMADDGKDAVVSRAELQEIVQAVVGLAPKAIGIDIDFSTKDGRHSTKFDPVFLEYCLRSAVPIYVGVHTSVAEPQDRWLGSPNFASLAATISAPAPSRDLFTRRMPAVVSVPAVGSRCRSLAASVVQTGITSLAWWQRPFVSVVERVEERRGSQTLLALDEFLVNYAPLRALRAHKIKATTRGDIENATVSERLGGKYVFIGVAELAYTRGPDAFVLPEIGLVPGIYVHASAAYSLLHGPLLLLRWWARIAVDLVASFVVFAIVGWIDVKYRPHGRVATHRLDVIFTAVTILVVLFVGGWIVPYTRIFWPDFVLLCLTALLHRPVERGTLSAIRFIRPRVKPAARAIVFESEEEGPE